MGDFSMKRLLTILFALVVLSPLLMPGAYAQIGTATLIWANPTQNEDGSQLTDLTFIDV